MHRFAVLLAVFWLVPQFALAQDSIRKSVVKIHSKLRAPDVLRPWMKQPARSASGTGAIIDGKRILTNAHVVLYASQILVQADGSTERVRAEVEAIAPGADLAVLKLKDESLFEGRPPLELAEGLPTMKDTVNAYGFPIGGQQLSVTEGIISRVEFVGYRYGVSGLRIQVDAALNSGNSGGPAMSGGKIVGLVFSRITSADNIGYLIPADEIRMFLDDIKDGQYKGKPRLTAQLQTVENAALRSKLKLTGEMGGMMVTSTRAKNKSCPLKAWDVITHVGDQAIDKQGKIPVGSELRLSFQYLIAKLTRDGKLPVTVVRDGKPMKMEVPVKYGNDLLIPYLKGSYPRHFIVGPMVFSTPSQELIGGLPSRYRDAFAVRRSPLISRRFEDRKTPDEELVLIASHFPDPLVEGYDNQVLAVVDQVNDVEIKSLAGLVKAIRKAEGKYIVFKFAGAYEMMVFDRQELIDSTEQILEDEGIRYQMSPDLSKMWNEE